MDSWDDLRKEYVQIAYKLIWNGRQARIPPFSDNILILDNQLCQKTMPLVSAASDLHSELLLSFQKI